LWKEAISFVMSVFPYVRLSVRPHGTTRLPWNAFSCNLIPEYFQNTVAKFQVSLKPDKNNGYCTWRPIIHFCLYLAQLFLAWEMFLLKVVDEIKTQFICRNFLFFFFRKSSCCAVVWKNIVEPDRQQVTLWRMRIACWIPKVTNTRSECVIFISFPLQQCFHERTSSVTLHVHCPPCLF